MNISSEQMANLFLRLLKENDNYYNPFDDCFYMKQIIKALGRINSFKQMPDIAVEVFRQVRLAKVQTSLRNSVFKASIIAFFRMEKSIWKFQNLTVPMLDIAQEELLQYQKYIEATQIKLCKI